MQNPRFHGDPPYKAVAVHGGPGALGSLFPVARELGQSCGVLEPMQTARSVGGQVDELAEAIVRHASPPVALVGHSWGAWLAFLTAARRPELVGRLILVGSGPFEERWTTGMMDVRLSHLSDAEAREAKEILRRMESGELGNELYARFGGLMSTADTYAAAPPGEPYETAVDAAQHDTVWAEAAEMRRSGTLLAEAAGIACPVLAIHGDWDPHPWRGVKEPLEAAINDFRFVLLERCGHEPWREWGAKDRFFRILKKEIGD